MYIHVNIYIYKFMESFLSHGDTPSHPPFRTMGVSISHPAIGPHDVVETRLPSAWIWCQDLWAAKATARIFVLKATGTTGDPA